MASLRFLFVVLFFACGTSFAADKTIPDIVEQASESVVYIEGENSCGSGFIFRTEPEVEIYTNYHVMRDDKIFTISFFLKNKQTGQPEKITVKGWKYFIFPRIDFGVIKLAPDDPAAKAVLSRLKPLKIADSEKVRVGEHVFAIGSPSAGVITLGNSVSDGIIAGKNRFVNGIPFIQTTAPVNFGNSGGPLFNMNGEVVGIVTAKSIISENIGFALPIHMTIGKNYSFYLPDKLEGEAAAAMNEGVQLLEQNNTAEALKKFGKVQQLAPDRALGFVMEGITRNGLKQTPEAIALFEKALKMEKIKYDDMMMCILELGKIYGKANQSEKAIEIFLRGVERDPTNADLNRNIGIAYANAGKKSKALAHWYISLSANPDQPELEKLFLRLCREE